MSSDCTLFNQKIYPALTSGNGTMSLCCTSSLGINVNNAPPSAIFSISSLQLLDLSNNALNWNLDSVLKNSKLANLQSLAMPNTSITGTTTYLSMLPKVQTIYLGSNQLSGPINANISTLQYLRVLYLDHNLLTGSIPAELSNLANLQQMDLSYNELNARLIPSSIQNMKSFSNFNFNDQAVITTTPTAYGTSTAIPTESSSSTPLLGLYIALPVLVLFIGILVYLYMRRKRTEKRSLEDGKHRSVRFSIDDPTDTCYESARPSTAKQDIVPPVPVQRENLIDSPSESSDSSDDDNANLGQIFNKISRKAIDKSSSIGTNESTRDGTTPVNDPNPTMLSNSNTFELPMSEPDDFGMNWLESISTNQNLNESLVQDPSNIHGQQDYSNALEFQDYGFFNRIQITDDAKSTETSIADCSDFQPQPPTTGDSQLDEEPKDNILPGETERQLKVTTFEKEHHIGGEVDANERELGEISGQGKPNLSEFPKYYLDSFVSLPENPFGNQTDSPPEALEKK
ncbi:hypothetical protein HDV01_004177 [Terramyces sp. JEL0728]|nr:hypothetical protein HDV01_004177 [Terramyces sp. JEL0728]